MRRAFVVASLAGAHAAGVPLLVDADGERIVRALTTRAAPSTEAGSRRFEASDKDGDQVLNRNEYQLEFAHMRFDASDTDGDGKLSWEELDKSGLLAVGSAFEKERAQFTIAYQDAEGKAVTVSKANVEEVANHIADRAMAFMEPMLVVRALGGKAQHGSWTFTTTYWKLNRGKTEGVKKLSNVIAHKVVVDPFLGAEAVKTAVHAELLSAVFAPSLVDLIVRKIVAQKAEELAANQANGDQETSLADLPGEIRKMIANHLKAQAKQMMENVEAVTFASGQPPGHPLNTPQVQEERTDLAPPAPRSSEGKP